MLKATPVTLVSKFLMTTVNLIMSAEQDAARRRDVLRQNSVLIHVSIIQIVRLNVALEDFVHF